MVPPVIFPPPPPTPAPLMGWAGLGYASGLGTPQGWAMPLG